MLRPATSVSLMVLTAALLSPVSAATGEPPTPVDPMPEIIAAGEACSFAISVVATGKEGFVALPNNPQFSRIAPSPGLRITVTNLSDPDNSVTVNATGAFRFVDLSDGSTEIRASGHNFLWRSRDRRDGLGHHRARHSPDLRRRRLRRDGRQPGAGPRRLC